MRQYRTGQEALTDKAVLLALLYRVNTCNDATLGDRLRIQNLTFLFCYGLFRRRLKALNYTFFTYRWGPFTKDLYEAEADFEQADLIQRKGQMYSLTETGLKWGQSIYDALANEPDNLEIVEQMDEVIDKYACDTTKCLVNYTHEMDVVPVGWHEEERLDELPYHLDLTAVVDEEEATAIVEIYRGLLDSFAMALDRSRSMRTISVI